MSALPFLALLAQSHSSDAAPLILVAFIALVGVAFLVVWIWSLIHCIRNPRLSDTNRIIGIVLIVVLGVLGSLIYLFLPRDSQAVR